MPFEILVVEDNDAVRNLSVEAFEIFFPDAKINSASNGMLGWQLIQSNIPKIVVSDINMPELNGIELLKRIRKDYPQIVVIFLSGEIGYAEGQISRESAISLGAAEAFTKPTSYSIVAGEIRKHLN